MKILKNNISLGNILIENSQIKEKDPQLEKIITKDKEKEFLKLVESNTLINKFNFEIEIDGYIYFVVNITSSSGNKLHFFWDQKHAELESSIQEIKEQDYNQLKLSSLGEMAAGIAHDINNPLGVIIASLESARFEIQDLEEKDDYASLPADVIDSINEFKESLTDIEKGASRAADIVEGMRMYSRKDQKDFREQDINLVLKTSESFAKLFLEKNSVDLTINYTQEEIKIPCKEIMLSQVLVNMLKNSCDAIATLPAMKKWIEISIIDDPQFVTIKVQDGGSGIPQEVQSKVFEPFFTTKGVGKGTGLGLSMAYQIAKDHSGSVSIDNASKNTTILLKLSKNPVK